MKTSLFACLLLQIILGWTLSAIGAPGSLNFERAEVSQVLAIYQSMSGMELLITPEAKSVIRTITLKTNTVTQEDALKLLKQALLDQGGLVITPLDATRASVTCKDPRPGAPTNGTLPVIDISRAAKEADLDRSVGRRVKFTGRYLNTKTRTISNGKVSIEVKGPGSYELDKDATVTGVLKKVSIAPTPQQDPLVQSVPPGTHYYIE